MLKKFLQTKKDLYKLIPILQKQKFPGELGLLRMKDLLHKLESPHKKFISVHIAGTAGKGSTSYLIARIMQEAGLKVGLTISPHLQTMRERMQVNGRLISKKEFISLINQIKPVVKEMESGKWGKPSYFEVLLAAAFLYFAQKKVDLAVVETGMGGRVDGTNALQSRIAVLTNIGLDHTKVLGKTKNLILKDKMQIIKPDCSAVITCIAQKNLLKIIKKHCQVQNASLFVYKQDFNAENKYSNQNHSQFNFIFNKKRIKDIKLNLAGIYQIDNACLAIASCLKLTEATKFQLSNRAIKKALSKTFFPGRMETVSRKPLVILDGAHNEDKIKALIQSIKQIYPQEKFIIVFGIKKDKKVKKILLLLKTISDEFVLTQFGRATDMGFKLNYPARKLFQQAKKIMPKIKLHLRKDINKALKKAQKLARIKEMSVLLTGSLYLVGEARQYFKLRPDRRARA